MTLPSWMSDYDWFHSILIDGHRTPGLFGDSQLVLESIVGRYSFDGQKVLDVGTLDGKWGFVAAAKGAAEVLAIDIELRPNWSAAKSKLGLASRVTSQKTSLQDLADHAAYFDICMDFGVYYHVDDLLLHFRKLREVLRPGGMAQIEGEVILHTTSQSGYPSVAYFSSVYENGDYTIHWVPSPTCLIEILGMVGLVVVSQNVYLIGGHRGRIFVEAIRS